MLLLTPSVVALIGIVGSEEQAPQTASRGHPCCVKSCISISLKDCCAILNMKVLGRWLSKLSIGDLSVSLSIHCRKLDVVACACNPALGGRQAEPWGHWPIPDPAERPYVKDQSEQLGANH